MYLIRILKNAVKIKTSVIISILLAAAPPFITPGRCKAGEAAADAHKGAGASPAGVQKSSSTEGKAGNGNAARTDGDLTMADLQSLMAAYYGPDPRQELADKAGKDTLEINRWADARSKELAAEQALLDAQAKSLNEIGGQLKELVGRLNGTVKSSMTRAEVDEYNQKTRQINAVAARELELRRRYNAAAVRLQAAVAAFDGEQRDRIRRLDGFKAYAAQRAADYAAWHNSGKGEAFSQLINARYAALLRAKKPQANAESADKDLRILRSLRGQLGAYAKRGEDAKENGLIIVPARLGGEDAYFIVDTGATITTVSPALAQALGAADKPGPEITITLAAGIKIKGPEVVLPALTVCGKTADQVRAVAMEPSMAGVDGLLGHSFLDQFDFRINRTGSPKLELLKKSPAR